MAMWKLLDTNVRKRTREMQNNWFESEMNRRKEEEDEVDWNIHRFAEVTAPKRKQLTRRRKKHKNQKRRKEAQRRNLLFFSLNRLRAQLKTFLPTQIPTPSMVRRIVRFQRYISFPMVCSYHSQSEKSKHNN